MRTALAVARESITPLWALAGILRELTKARLTALVLITTLTGYFVAQTGFTDWLAGLHVLLGTGMVAAGGAVTYDSDYTINNFDRGELIGGHFHKAAPGVSGGIVEDILMDPGTTVTAFFDPAETGLAALSSSAFG